MADSTYNELIIISVIGTTLVVLFVIGLVFLVVLSRIRAYSHQLEQELTTRRHQQELLRQEAEAQERERQRIARDLHDEIGSALLMTKACLATIGDELNDDRKCRVEHLAQRTGETIEGLQRIISELTPPSLELMHLTEALRFYCQLVTQSTGMLIEMEIEMEMGMGMEVEERQVRNLPPDTQIALYRTLQEIIANAVKHAQCKAMDIIWQETTDAIEIKVLDNGIGFNLKEYHRGNGLRNMHNRVTLCGGTLKIDSSPGKGTRHYIHIPFENEQKPNTL